MTTKIVEEISMGIATDNVSTVHNSITQVGSDKIIKSKIKTIFKTSGRFNCPCCDKGIYFEIEKEIDKYSLLLEEE
jgi:hypothetical protein